MPELEIVEDGFLDTIESLVAKGWSEDEAIRITKESYEVSPFELMD
jgi:hypothetical protein